MRTLLAEASGPEEVKGCAQVSGQMEGLMGNESRGLGGVVQFQSGECLAMMYVWWASIYGAGCRD